MKQLNITWDGIADSTGYLFSFAKALSCAVKSSPYRDKAEDIVTTSGFAFRMWVAADLCPSSTSIWGFDGQKPWTESGGLACAYVGRYWGEEHVEEERRLEAIGIIKRSIDDGIPAVSWDIGVPEWGLVIGYDDEAQTLATLSAGGATGTMRYEELGKNEIPILSVLTILGQTEKPQASILADTLAMAANHLRGGEWCDNAKGLEAYPALYRHFEADDPALALSWNMEYLLGTYAALKPYAWKYFAKNNLGELAQLYQTVADCWQRAFEAKTTKDMNDAAIRADVAALLRTAEDCEKRAVGLMAP